MTRYYTTKDFLLLHAIVFPQSSFHATLVKRSPTY